MSLSFTGVDELRRGAAELVPRARATGKAVCVRTATRVRDAARARLQAQTHGTGATADAIAVTVERTPRGAAVVAAPVPGRHPDVPAFLEFGTTRMAARPYLRPSMAEAEHQFAADLDTEVEATIREVLA